MFISMNWIRDFVDLDGLDLLQLIHQFSLSTAVGLFQSVVCVIFLFMSNSLAKKFGERGIW